MKNSFIVSVTSVALFLLTGCNKISENGTSYPRDFPQECITSFDNHARFIEKLRVSGRFNEESISEREGKILTMLDNFKNPPRQRKPAREEYVIACQQMESLTQVRMKGLENMANLSDEELERTVGVFLKSSR